MTWTTPRTWLPGDTATDGIFNNEVRDNLLYRLNPPYVWVTSTSTYTTTSLTYVPVNATFTVAMVTSGGPILVGFSGWISRSVLTIMAIGMDGGSEQEIWRSNNQSGAPDVQARGHALFIGLAAGQHTPTMRWKVGSGTGTLRGIDDGGNGIAISPILFWAIEI